jgi:MFS family permease
MQQLPILYLITGIFSMAAGPFLGRISDAIGKFRVFTLGSAIAIVIILYYTNLGVTPFWVVVTLNTVLMFGVLSRMISSSALITAIPEPSERGAFMSINSSVQQLSGGIASVIAGLIVVQTTGGKLMHYNTIGFIVAGTIIITIFMLRSINNNVLKKSKLQTAPSEIQDDRSLIPVTDPIDVVN